MLVSIIIVTHNRPLLLSRAIESVVAQSYRPLELVLVDNQSDIPVKIPSDSQNISAKVVRTDRFMNASASRNFGVSKSTGDLIGFLDDDDFFLPGKIDAQMASLADAPDADFSIIDTEIREDGATRIAGLKDIADLFSLLAYRPIHTNSPLIRRRIFEKIHFDERLDKYTDLSLTFRMFEQFQGVKAKGIGSVWMCDDRSDQITNKRYLNKLKSLHRNYRNWKIICDDFAHLIDPEPELRKRYYGKLAILAALSLRPSSALHYGFATIRLRNNVEKQASFL